MTLGFLGDLLGLNNGDPTIDAAKKNSAAVTSYGTQANDILGTGYNAAKTDLTNSDNLSKLLLNGVGTTYTSSPGYEFGLDQGLQALERTAASRGGLGGGGTSADILDYATGTASKDYNNWLSQLSGAVGTGIGTSNNLANLETGNANSQLGIAGDVLNGTLGANNQTAAGETANSEGLSNLFGNIVGGVSSLATGGLSNLAKVGNIFGNASQGAAANPLAFGQYGGFGAIPGAS